MAITAQDLIDAAADAQSLEDIVNGAANFNGTGVVVTRLGQEINTVAKIIQQINDRVNVLRYDTRALLFADLLHIAGTLAVVTNDSTPAYNTFYKKAGASGAGSWSAINLITPDVPAINGGDASKLVAVKSDESGYELVAGLPKFGVNAVADTTNRLSVASAGSLFSYATSGGHAMKVNKALLADTASLAFQNATSTRAILGLLGDDDFTMKVSTDGSVFNTSFIIAKASGDIDFQKKAKFKSLGFAASTELTIASGSVTPTQTYHSIDTQSDAAADDLDTIVTTNIPDGSLITLRLENSSRVVTLKHGTGNLQLLDGDIVMDSTIATVTLMRVGSNLIQYANNFGGADAVPAASTTPIAFSSTGGISIPIDMVTYSEYEIKLYIPTGGQLSSFDVSIDNGGSFSTPSLSCLKVTSGSVTASANIGSHLGGGAGQEPSYTININQLTLVSTSNCFGTIQGSSRNGNSLWAGFEMYINATPVTHVYLNFSTNSNGYYYIVPKNPR